MADCIVFGFNGEAVGIKRELPIETKAFMMPGLSIWIPDIRTQDQKDYDEAWEEVNRIAPGWRD